VIASPVSAQPPLVPFGQGTHAFRVILHRAGMKPITRHDELLDFIDEDKQDRVLVISLGKTDWLAEFPRGLERFVERGGGLLVATDQFSGSTLDELGYHVDGHFVRVPASSPMAYRGSADCPLVKPLETKKCTVFQGLHRVATNRPSFVHHHLRFVFRPHEQEFLAVFPKECEVSGGRIEGDGPPFAVASERGKGRVLILADHSVFINDMMLPTDNDNFDLARNAIAWLSDGGKRNRVCFMDDGVLVTDFNVPVKEPPPPPLPSEADLIRMFNKTVVGLEKEDFFHRQFYRGVRPIHVLQTLIIAFTVALAAYGLMRLVRARHHVDTQAPRLTPVLASVTPTPAVIDERQRATLAEDNFWEAAHGLARQFFDAAPGGTRGEMVPQVGGSAAPRQQREWRRQVGRLWQLARTTKPRRVAGREFERVASEIKELQAALADGSLRLT
jgi:hypothetical protein